MSFNLSLAIRTYLGQTDDIPKRQCREHGPHRSQPGLPRTSRGPLDIFRADPPRLLPAQWTRQAEQAQERKELGIQEKTKRPYAQRLFRASTKPRLL